MRRLPLLSPADSAGSIVASAGASVAVDPVARGFQTFWPIYSLGRFGA